MSENYNWILKVISGFLIFIGYSLSYGGYMRGFNYESFIAYILVAIWVSMLSK